MDNKQRIALDIRDNQTYEQIYTKQYNMGFPVEFIITKDGEPFDLSGTIAIFEMKKPDGNIYECNCDISGNIVSITVDEQMTAIEGKAKYQITLFEASSYQFEDKTSAIIITTVTGVMKIDKATVQNDDIQSSSEIGIITEVLVRIEDTKIYAENAKSSADEAKTYMTNASTYANTSKSYAVGGTSARDGEDTDNSKYYSEQAKTSADTATTKASEASASSSSAYLYAQQASSASKGADEYALTAKEYAQQSRSYSTGDVGYRDDEKTDNAKYYSEQAESSATSATSSANTATIQASTAKAYAEQCKSISESLSGALKPKGTVAFDDLPDLADVDEGDMYNISNEFTTTSDFKEGKGYVTPLGSNIFKTTDGQWDVLAGSPVTGIKGNAESSYRRGNVNITPDNIGALAIDGDSTDNIVTFTSNDSTNITTWTDVDVITSKEKHSSLFAKVSTMFKNVRYLFKMLGTTDISGIGDGTTTGAINVLNSSKQDSLLGGAYTGDMNDLKTAGRYWCKNAANLPSGTWGTWGLCDVLQATSPSNEYVQVVYNNNGIYTRVYANSQWYAWVEKQNTITGAATTITSSNLTASRALVSNSSGKVATSSVTSTELGYVHGVTSAIQTQLNRKQAVLAFTSGQGTRNSTYATGGSCTWRKWGRLVIVDIYDLIVANVTVGDATTNILFSGLPVCSAGSVTNISSLTAGQKSIRVGIAGGSTNINLWWQNTGTAGLSGYSGQLIYISID